jgi:hypothetical protein
MRECLFARDQSSFCLPDQANPQPVNETEMRFWLPRAARSLSEIDFGKEVSKIASFPEGVSA